MLSGPEERVGLCLELSKALVTTGIEKKTASDYAGPPYALGQ